MYTASGFFFTFIDGFSCGSWKSEIRARLTFLMSHVAAIFNDVVFSESCLSGNILCMSSIKLYRTEARIRLMSSKVTEGRPHHHVGPGRCLKLCTLNVTSLYVIQFLNGLSLYKVKLSSSKKNVFL